MKIILLALSMFFAKNTLAQKFRNNACEPIKDILSRQDPSVAPLIKDPMGYLKSLFEDSEEFPFQFSPTANKQMNHLNINIQDIAYGIFEGALNKRRLGPNVVPVRHPTYEIHSLLPGQRELRMFVNVEDISRPRIMQVVASPVEELYPHSLNSLAFVPSRVSRPMKLVARLIDRTIPFFSPHALQLLEEMDIKRVDVKKVLRTGSQDIHETFLLFNDDKALWAYTAKGLIEPGNRLRVQFSFDSNNGIVVSNVHRRRGEMSSPNYERTVSRVLFPPKHKSPLKSLREHLVEKGHESVFITQTAKDNIKSQGLTYEDIKHLLEKGRSCEVADRFNTRNKVWHYAINGAAPSNGHLVRLLVALHDGLGPITVVDIRRTSYLL